MVACIHYALFLKAVYGRRAPPSHIFVLGAVIIGIPEIILFLQAE